MWPRPERPKYPSHIQYPNIQWDPGSIDGHHTSKAPQTIALEMPQSDDAQNLVTNHHKSDDAQNLAQNHHQSDDARNLVQNHQQDTEAPRSLATGNLKGEDARNGCVHLATETFPTRSHQRSRRDP